MRIWFKKWKDNRMVGDITIERKEQDTRTHKIFAAVEDACVEFHLSQPIWLDLQIREFQRFAKTRFTQDCFIEEIDFDYLEIHVLDEDE